VATARDPLTPPREARRIAANIAKLPELLSEPKRAPLASYSNT
jgi:hypothetical protein